MENVSHEYEGLIPIITSRRRTHWRPQRYQEIINKLKLTLRKAEVTGHEVFWGLSSKDSEKFFSQFLMLQEATKRTQDASPGGKIKGTEGYFDRWKLKGQTHHTAVSHGTQDHPEYC